MLAACWLAKESSDGASGGASGAKAIAGKCFNVCDWDENIVCAYHSMAGSPPPPLTLPFALLWLLVRAAVALAVAAHALFGVQILHPKRVSLRLCVYCVCVCVCWLVVCVCLGNRR